MSIELPVQRQLDAYNAHDIEAFVAQYADDVQVFRPPALEPILSGKTAFKTHYANNRFTIPTLHARLAGRMISRDVVVDHEQVAGLGPDMVEVIAVYKVANGLIQTVWFY